jgi:hypothetical protein
MKKLLMFFSAAACAALLLSCSSTKQNPVASDSYGDTPTALPQISPSAGTGSVSSEKDPYNEKKIKGKKTFTEQLLATDKYVKVGASSLFINTTFGKLQQCSIDLIYKPQTDLAGFMARYDTSLYNFYMAQADRHLLINAVNTYLSDFEEKKLIRKTGKTVKIYGEAHSYEEFGVVEIMMPNISKPDVYLGYRFLKDSPYFCIKVHTSPNIAENLGSGKVPESIEQCYYFTKAQAQALADFLSDESVAKAAGAYEAEHASAPQAKDTY